MRRSRARWSFSRFPRHWHRSEHLAKRGHRFIVANSDQPETAALWWPSVIRTQRRRINDSVVMGGRCRFYHAECFGLSLLLAVDGRSR